ncbi:SRPBCC domain-containing protein [Paraliomyxa miuraensis]|uniref:SRPBCC domain-containing protein n=1 Tax=Paraliomyxa miuraensis TaxID=376150 RepID=UPI00224E15D6|nr:SRPBCC domain-containing protein [Paraliomyxa miuraensis]MCX4241546.1 SRPBCC domain-containing protein [Paraliomyxa miuraensis]
MSTTTDPATTKIFEIYIKAPASEIWTAITDPEWTARYGYKGPSQYELRPGGAFRAHATPGMREMGLPDVVVDGEVLEVDPPRKLVQTYRFLFNEETKAEGFSRLTWEINETGAGFCRVTITHELEGLPGMAGAVSSKFNEQGGGGWGWILSDLKSLLETGKAMA